MLYFIPRTSRTGIAAGTRPELLIPAARIDRSSSSSRHDSLVRHLVPMPMLTPFVRTARPFAPARSRSMPSTTWRSLVC